MKWFVILIGLLLNACASQPYQAALNQSEWTTYKCSGIKNWNDCKQAALQACPGGFHIKNEFENITIQRREFEVACKA